MKPQSLEKNKPSFLFISNWYPAALEHFKISDKNYGEYETELSSKLLDIAHLYSLNLNKLGYQSKAVISNHENLQKRWAEENGITFSNFSPPHLARHSYFLRSVVSKFPKIYYSFKNVTDKKTWNWQISMAQIKKFRPDVLLIFDLHYFTPPFLKEARKYVGKIVGEIASPIMMPEEHFRNYDLLLSSMPHYIRKFQKMGISSAYLPYAFESTILEKIGEQKRKYDCVFIGGLSRDLDKIPLLEELAKKINIDFWGYSQLPLDKSSSILSRYHGSVWGIDMYRILAQSKIVVNCHTKRVGDYFDHEDYADNMRLYESTGMGAMLITDMKKNLGDLFEIDKEVIAYNEINELVEKIKYYLKNEKEREKIARAGQARTLKAHSYKARAERLLEITDSNI